ncbi:MAG: hypothetical protein AAF497_18265 [Planctomycetota bacterium]
MKLRLPRFRLSNILWLMVCCSILLAWRADRLKLIDRYNQILNPRPSWGTCQAEGPPDTPGSGDIATAWASKTQDGQKEWLIADYGTPLTAQTIEVHETYNPGAVEKITGIDGLGMETILWQGVDPAPPGAGRSVSKFPIRTKKQFQKFKVYLDSPAVAGWNEIDAIGVKTTKGSKKWARKVTSSSSYGDTYGTTAMFPTGGQTTRTFRSLVPTGGG